MIELIRYSALMQPEWDAFVSKARNSTLLHLRPYMDYHKDRFEDCSLVFRNRKGQIVALLPACRSNKEENTIASHEGLTYGGLIIAPHLHAADISLIIEKAIHYYKTELSAQRLVIKPIPHIYCSSPSEEELYVLTRKGAILRERHLSQAISIACPAPMSLLRKRSIAKACKNGVQVGEAQTQNEWRSFHRVLTDVLAARHKVKPVHNAEELLRLHSLFPNEIRLLCAYKGGELLAGAVIYLSPLVAHTQYLAASDEGRAVGALDLVIKTLLEQPYVQERRYLDFGVSTERDGSLNTGLAAQKEGFGATGVCYDTYSLDL